MNRPIVEAVGLGKRYESGPASTQVLTDVSFAVASGESVAIVGVSGFGKSTLLHLLGGLDSPSEGSVSLLGDRKSTRLNSSHLRLSRMPSSA